jgi:hypothetical protein
VGVLLLLSPRVVDEGLTGLHRGVRAPRIIPVLGDIGELGSFGTDNIGDSRWDDGHPSRGLQHGVRGHWRLLGRLILRRKSDQGIKGFFAGLKATVEQDQRTAQE